MYWISATILLPPPPRALAIIYKYRLLVFLVTIALSWLILGNRKFLIFFGYILAYPFVVVLWKVPRLVFRNWAIAIAFFPAIYATLSALRENFVAFIAALVASLSIYLAESPVPIITCMVILAIYLIAHYIQRFRIAYSPSTVFAGGGPIVQKMWEAFKASDIVKRPPLDGLEEKSEEYRAQLGQNLLKIYAVSTMLHFLAERLREVISSRKMDIYFLGSLVYTVLLTSLLFAFEYLGLEHLAPGSFSGVTQPTLLDFFGFSISTLMTSDISPIKASSGYAQIMAYFQLIASLLIMLLLVFVVLTSIRERFRQDLDGIINELGNTSSRIGGLLEANYELTHAAAEAWLLESDPILTKWLLKLRYGEARAREISDAIEGVHSIGLDDSIKPCEIE